ncbi:Gfo/Idh/MocA family protein [Streptomyces sp. 7-21]|uniref:Gfo/Idh/MocA family protein n=1 Tax=Streptomyces sp. 7-21 TaxID=2802283 RepID=UPI00191EB45D|nr:Gfo/Idh/MocA family oxidoreductase [Streptomyces sp. 7-21]MBL1069175.1 Gfo/Idh/MocA family oxidoreductase [Streptomyces sp. 7-21]
MSWTTSRREPMPVVLAGARGHGRWHLANIGRLARQGLVRLAGICELTPLSQDELGDAAACGGHQPPEQSDDLDGLLARTGAEAAVICTPIHTHEDLGLIAARRGVHLLLEKPPTPSLAAFRALAEGVDGAGIACQIGFQSLGSHAIEAIRGLVASGGIGAVRGIGAAGAWVRDEAYWTRAPWSGHRTLGGRDVVDGVLTNPLAHATATALRIDGSEREEDLTAVELELYRANDIAADDTSSARLHTARGTRVVTAVTLCAQRPGEPYVVVHGDEGRVTFWYKADKVVVERPGRPPQTTAYGRTDLLANLVSHVRHGEPLLVPLAHTGAFTRFVEAVRTAPEPRPLPASAWHTERTDSGPRRVVPGIDALTAEGARRLALYSELGVPWATAAPHTVRTR